MPKSKPIKIAFFVNEGEFDTEDISCTKQLLAEAGAKLDRAYSSDICGTPIFKGTNGKWYVGSVEFVVSPVNPEYLANELADGEHCECPCCKHIDSLDAMAPIGPEDTSGDGLCTSCTHVSFKITKARAQEIAGITKPKRQRRPGGLK